MGRENGTNVDKEEEKVGLVKRVWNKLGLDIGTLMIMFKGACSPVVSLALYQWQPFTAFFPTIGFLVAVVSVLAMPIQPRAKFIQTMIFNILAICIGAAMSLLVCYSAVQARMHTTVPNADGSPRRYNSSASAVSAIWLFFNIMSANALRFARPQFQITAILYSIMIIVASTYSPIFMSMAQATGFVELLLETFLTGFAVATVVHFVVFPMSSRQVLMKQYAGYIGAVKAAIIAQRAYLQSMENQDMLQTQDDQQGHKATKQEVAAKDLRAKLVALTELHGKVHADLPFAKREMAYGKLSPKDLGTIFTKFRAILLPTIGLGSVADIFARISKARKWEASSDSSTESANTGTKEGEESPPGNPFTEQQGWNEIMQALHEPFQSVSDASLDGLDHILYTLGIQKPKDKSQDRARSAGKGQDVESQAVKRPGDHKYGEHLETRLREFRETRKAALRAFCKQQGVDMEDMETTSAGPQSQILENTHNGKNRQQLYLILYMEHLLQTSANAILSLVHFADEKVEDGTMQKSKIIMPGWHRTKKWFKSAFSVEDTSNESQPDSAEANMNSLKLGDAFYHRKDPEHLPATNAFQKFGNGIRSVSETMRSQEVAFGFRVGCATMSLAIINYLESTQPFFIRYRFLWAVIMTAITMTMTAGSNVFGFLGRVAGTAVAMIMSLVVWYIAGGRGIAGAALPVLFVVIFFEMYFFVKYPRFLIINLVALVTQVLIIGYELQAERIGPEAVESNGQIYWPIYIFAPYRLATVILGILVAFIFTFFPYPLTARSALRNQLGQSLYLLANFYSCVHTTIRMRLAGTGGDPEDKRSPSAKLEKARNKILGKKLVLLTQLRQHSAFIPFEFALGGKFPKETYDRLITTSQHLLDYMALMSFSTRAYTQDFDDPENMRWIQDLRSIASQVKSSSHEITSILILISSSLINATPLPPYLSAPSAYRLTAKLNEIDPDLLSLRHITEPGYSAFAVTQVAGALIHDDLKNLLEDVKGLVGEVDFSFHIVSTSDSDSDVTLISHMERKGKND